jgi:hypothetical protein
MAVTGIMLKALTDRGGAGKGRADAAHIPLHICAPDHRITAARLTEGLRIWSHPAKG